MKQCLTKQKTNGLTERISKSEENKHLRWLVELLTNQEKIRKKGNPKRDKFHVCKFCPKIGKFFSINTI